MSFYFKNNYILKLYKLFKNAEGVLLFPIIDEKESTNYKSFLSFIKARQNTLYTLFQALVETYLAEFTYFSDSTNIEEYSAKHSKNIQLIGKIAAYDLILLFLK